VVDISDIAELELENNCLGFHISESWLISRWKPDLRYKLCSKFFTDIILFLIFGLLQQLYSLILIGFLSELNSFFSVFFFFRESQVLIRL